MTQPRNNRTNAEALPDRVRSAVEHAQQLSDSDDRFSARWVEAAKHVGDISVLAIARPDDLAA